MTDTKQSDRETRTNVKNTYIEVIDWGGPPKANGRIEVHVAVWADKEMTELIALHECFSINSMNRALESYAYSSYDYSKGHMAIESEIRGE